MTIQKIAAIDRYRMVGTFLEWRERQRQKLAAWEINGAVLNWRRPERPTIKRFVEWLKVRGDEITAGELGCWIRQCRRERGAYLVVCGARLN